MHDKADDVVNVDLDPEDALRLLLDDTDLREQESSDDIDKPVQPPIKAHPE